MSNENVFDVIGKTPQDVYADMERYSEWLHELNAQWPKLLVEYPDRWIVFREREVILDAGTFEDALAMVDNEGIARDRVLIRQVETEPAVMIVQTVLSGFFNEQQSDRPYIGGQVIIPRLKVAFGIQFLVDTGADVTTISPRDGSQAQVPYDMLSQDQAIPVGGFGGSSDTFMELALVGFAESRKLYLYQLPIGLVEDKPENYRLPSVVGNDILRKWRTVYCPKDKILEADVLEADLSLEI